MVASLTCLWGHATTAASDDPTQPVAAWRVQRGEVDLGVVTLPAHLSDAEGDAAPTFALSANVQIQDSFQGRHLWLILPTYDGAARLFVDGAERMPRQDPPAWRHHGTYRWYLGLQPDADSVLHLELRVGGAFVQARWVDTVPVISTEPETPVTRAIFFVNDRLALIAIGLMTQVSIVCLVLYYMRRQKQYLYFALEALGASVYDYDLLALSSHVVGAYDMGLVGAALCFACLMSVYFLYAHFDLGRPHRGWKVLLLFAALCGIFARSRGIVLPLLVLFSLAPAIVENIRVCVHLILSRKPRAEASILLAAWSLLTFSVVGEFCPWLGLGEVFWGLRPGGAGLGLFAVVLCLLLTTGYGQAMQQTEALNKELKRQIKDRSRQMYNALAIAGGEPRDNTELKPGQLVQSRYKVVQPLGRGGMGAVYEVTRLSDNTPMALKVTRNVDGRALSRLAKEAELGIQVQDSNVVTLADVDVADEGFIYIVMELVRGPALEACRAAMFKDVLATLLILQRVSPGLCALHARGIIHRDLKPANVLTNYPWDNEADAVVKIADFGISRIEGPRAEIYNLRFSATRRCSTNTTPSFSPAACRLPARATAEAAPEPMKPRWPCWGRRATWRRSWLWGAALSRRPPTSSAWGFWRTSF